MKEAYCSFEVSKLLKKKWFDESTQFVWYEHLPSPNAVHNSEIGKPKRDYFIGRKKENIIHRGLIILLYLFTLEEKFTHVQHIKWL